MYSHIAELQQQRCLQFAGGTAAICFVLYRRAQVEVKAVELLRHREHLEGSGKSQAVRLDELARKEAEVAQREGEAKVGAFS